MNSCTWLLVCPNPFRTLPHSCPCVQITRGEKNGERENKKLLPESEREREKKSVRSRDQTQRPKTRSKQEQKQRSFRPIGLRHLWTLHFVQPPLFLPKNVPVLSFTLQNLLLALAHWAAFFPSLNVQDKNTHLHTITQSVQRLLLHLLHLYLEEKFSPAQLHTHQPHRCSTRAASFIPLLFSSSWFSLLSPLSSHSSQLRVENNESWLLLFF